MATIHDLRLTVARVEGHPATRHLRVEYELELGPHDPAIGRDVVERVLVHAVDEHDAAVAPTDRPVVDVRSSFLAQPGRSHRSAEATVHRLALDVEGDWWGTGLGGEAVPIAEWLDHLVGEVRLAIDGEELAASTTPVVTGSWGVLGHD